MPDRRATIDTMNKVLDDLFGAKKYSKGSIDAIPVGKRQYPDDLKMLSEAGITEAQLKRLMDAAKVSQTSQKMIQVKDNVKTDQPPIIRNQKEVSKISNAFINQHTRDALVTSNTEVNKYSERAVKDTGYFARIKKLMSNPAKLRQALEESFKNQQQFAGRPIFDKTFKGLGSQIGMVHSGVAHNLKFIEELNRVGNTFDTHRANVQANRIRGGSAWENVAPMLGRIVKDPKSVVPTNQGALSAMLNSMGVRPSTTYQAQTNQQAPTLTPIALPSNPAKATEAAAAQFVAEQKRQQAMRQASSVGQSLARSNFMKTLSRQNKPQSMAIPNLNFIPTRESSPQVSKPSFFQRHRDTFINAGLGAAGVAGLGYLGSIISQIPMALPFASGGSIPRYMGGGNPSYSPEQLEALRTYISDSKPINAALMKGESHPIYETLKTMATPLDKDITAYKGLSSQWKKQLGPLREGKNVGLNALMSLTTDFDEAMGYVEGDRANQMKMLEVTLGKGTPVVRPPEDMMIPGSKELIAILNNEKFQFGKKTNLGEDGTMFNMAQRRANGGGVDYFTGKLDMGGIRKVVDPNDPRYRQWGILDKLKWAFKNIGAVKPSETDTLDYQLRGQGLMKTPNHALGMIKSNMERALPYLWGDRKRFAFGGDLLRNIHLTKSPNAASSLVNSNVVNSLQSTADHTGITNLLNSMIRSGSSDSAFRGLFYRKGLNQDEWMEKVHQMKLQDINTQNYGMYAGFANGGNIDIAKSSIFSKLKGNKALASYFDNSPLNIKSFDKSPIEGVDRTHYDPNVDLIRLIGDELPHNIEHEIAHARINQNILAGHDVEALQRSFKGVMPRYAKSMGFNTFANTHDNSMAASYALDEMLAQAISTKGIESSDYQAFAKNFITQEGTAGYLGNESAQMEKAVKLRQNIQKHFKFAFGGDTFNTPLASSAAYGNISQDAVKRLQLLKIRAQAGQRLKGLRADAQIGMQMGNTSLFRSPETAAGVINARVIRNLESIFSGQKMGKFASGGQSYNNPIRVSDGELGIPRGMVDKIGLSTLRKINAGDMSGIGSFAAGGLMEFDGPGTGTSDSILTDADRGPRGADASDIGFVIRRTSSDRLKGLMGGVKGFYGGGNPFGSITAFGNTLDQITTNPTNPKKNIDYMPNSVLNIVKAAFANNPSGDAEDIYKSTITSQKFLQTSSKNMGGYENILPYTKTLKDTLEQVFGQKISAAEPVFDDIIGKNREEKFQAALDAVTKSLEKQVKAIDRSIKVEDNRTKDRSYSGTIIGSDDSAATGTYRGELAYGPGRNTPFGETNVNGLIEGGPENPPSRDELTSQTIPNRSDRGSLWNRTFAGMGSKFMQQLMNPTAMQYRVQGNIEMPIGAVGYQTEEQRAALESNRREYTNQPNIIRQRIRDEFGDILGDLNIEDLVKVTQGTKQVDRQFTTGVDVQHDPKTGENVVVPRTKTMQVEVGVTQVDASLLEEKLRGKMSADEATARVERSIQPSAQAKAGVTQDFGVGFKGEQIQKATVQVSRFHEEIKKVNMTQTGLYKMGDILRGVSWRFASLGMSAMGVYFSIQGLVMAFQQGLGSITTPLADVETLMKNIGMSTAFGEGIYNASEAMKDMSLNTEDMIEGWKNLTNIQGTIQTFFAGIGAKVFGDKDFADTILKSISKATSSLTSDKSIETFKNLIEAIAEALPAIVPAIESITAMLQIIADNPALIAMGAQLLMISMIVQPVASGLAAIVTIGGGFFTIANLFKSTSAALFGVAEASRAAGMGMAFFGASTLRVLTIATGLGIIYEILANIVNLTGILGNFKLPTFTGMALGAFGGGQAQGFANGGVVQSEGYDQVPGSPDDTIITAKAGEIVIDPKKKRQGFADAPSGLMPSAMHVNPAETTYNTAKNATLLEDGNRTAFDMNSKMNDTKDGNTWLVKIMNWPATWGEGKGNDNELPFDIGSILPEKLFGYNFNPNPNAGNPITNPTVQGNTNPLGWLINILGTNPNTNVNAQDNANANTQSNTNVNTVAPNDSLLAYIKDTFAVMYESIKGAGDAIVQAVQGTVEVIISGLMGALEGLMDVASRAAEVIGNLTVAIGNMEVPAPLKGAGQSIIEGVKNIPATVASIPSTIAGIPSKAVEGGMNFIKGGLNTANAQDIKYNYAGYRQWGDVSDYGPKDVKDTGFWDRFTNGKYVYPKQPAPTVGNTIKVPKAGQPNYGNVYGKQMWPGIEKWVPDFPVDFGPVLRDIVTSGSDPYATVLSAGSMIAENTAVGYGMGGLQRAAQSAPAWLSKLIGKGPVRNVVSSTIAGKVPAALGAVGTEAMGLINKPQIIIPAALVEGQQAMDKWTAGQSAAEFMNPDADYNKVTGIVTGGFIDAAFGKGIEVLSQHFGKSEDQMRKEVKGSWASDLGLNTAWQWLAGAGNIEKGKETTEGFGEWLKGGNLKVSDVLRDIIPDNLKLDNVPLIGSISAEGMATTINEDVYDVLASLANLNVSGLTGAGTAFIGMGAAGAELGQNTYQMMGENPWMAPFLGLSSLPFAGPFAAAMAMPQTSDWLMNSEYGSQPITPVSMGLPENDSYIDISNLSTAINELTTSNQTQQSQPIVVQITVSGEELATKGYIEQRIEAEVPNIMAQNQSRIVGH